MPKSSRTVGAVVGKCGGPIGKPTNPGDPQRMLVFSRHVEMHGVSDGRDVDLDSHGAICDEVLAHADAVEARYPGLIDAAVMPKIALHAAGQTMVYTGGLGIGDYGRLGKELEILSATVAQREAGGKLCAVVEGGMTRNHTVVLRVLERAGHAMVQEDIASAADNWFDHHLHRTTVGDLLSDLRLLGYVARQGGERSRKGHFITKSGVARLKQHPLLPESH